MADTNLDIPASHLSHNLLVTVRLKGERIWRARLWMATKMFVFAAWLGGFGGVSVEFEDTIHQWWRKRR